MDARPLRGGFADRAIGPARAFRAALEAMSRPGTVQRLTGTEPPAPLSVAAGTLLLTLTDPQTPVHLAGAWDTAGIRAWLGFHSGAPLVAAEDAMFAVGSWQALAAGGHPPPQPSPTRGEGAPRTCEAAAGLRRFRLGEPDYPDRSATLIVECDALGSCGPVLTGPGIRTQATLSLPDPAAFQANARLYPLGLDFFLTAGDRAAALPRTTRVEV